jgi:hypothetical protein
MDLKKIAFIIPFAIFAAFSIFMACSSDEEPPVVFPPTDQLQVYYISSADADDIVIDGELDEGIWQAATQSQLTAYDTSDYNPRAKIFLVKMSALCDSTYVYFSASWQDESETIRYREWKWDNQSVPAWRQDVNIREDNFAIFFEPNTGGTSLGLNEIGPNCLAMCHEDEKIMVNESGVSVDGWYWRSGLMNPLSSATDLYVVDSLDTDSLFNGLDTETMQGYLRNFEPVDTVNGIPIYWSVNPDIRSVIDSIIEDIDSTMHIDTNATIDTTYEVDTIWEEVTLTIIDHGDYLLAADTAVVDMASVDADSIFVPSYVIFEDRSGSRWDVEAKGTYFEGRWTVEFKRRMDTDNPDDVQFIIGDEIGMVIAVGDNSKDPHYGFEPILLKF